MLRVRWWLWTRYMHEDKLWAWIQWGIRNSLCIVSEIDFQFHSIIILTNFLHSFLKRQLEDTIDYLIQSRIIDTSIPFTLVSLYADQGLNECFITLRLENYKIYCTSSTSYICKNAFAKRISLQKLWLGAFQIDIFVDSFITKCEAIFFKTPTQNDDFINDFYVISFLFRLCGF